MKTNIAILFFLLYGLKGFTQGSLSVGRVLYLPFNGNTLDMSGGGHDAVNSGATLTTGISGAANTAYYFNGAAHMNVLHHADLAPGKFSLCAKVKVQGFYNAFCYNNIILSKGLARSPGCYSLQHTQTVSSDCAYEDVTRHNYRIDVQNISTTLPTIAGTPYIIPDNWDCVVGTFDGDTAKLYVNGVFRFQYYEPGYTPNMDQLLIGYLTIPGRPFYFTGSMDEIRIYNRVLSPAEIITYCDYITPDNTVKALFKDTTIFCLTKQFTDLSAVTSTALKLWRWDFGDGGSSTLASPAHTYTTTGTYAVKLVVTDSNGYVDSIIKTIHVGSTITADAGKDTSLCLVNGKATVMLKANKGWKTYAWTPSSGLSNPASSGTDATVTETTIFTLNTIDSLGCTGHDDIVVVAYPEPDIKAFPSDTTICESTPFRLLATGATSYLWSPAAGLNSTTIANPLVISPVHTTYSVSGTDEHGCTGSDTVRIRLSAPPLVRADPQTVQACQGDKIQLDATGAGSYTWSPAEGLSRTDIANPVLGVSGAMRYIVKGVRAGCIGYDTVFVTAYSLPPVKASSDGDQINCTISAVRLHAGGASQYFWTPTEYCDNSTSASPLVSPAKTVVFTVAGTDNNGCKAYDSVRVYFDETKSTIFVPNSFTPNDDQINDRLRIVDKCNFTPALLCIYNRWGQKIFETSTLGGSWDGTSNGGPCEIGVYYYLIKGYDHEGKEQLFKGDITLLR